MYIIYELFIFNCINKLIIQQHLSILPPKPSDDVRSSALKSISIGATIQIAHANGGK